MSQVTTHVLDAALGKPASGVAIVFDRQADTGWLEVASAATGTEVGRSPTVHRIWSELYAGARIHAAGSEYARWRCTCDIFSKCACNSRTV